MTSVSRVMTDVCRWTEDQSILGSPLPPHLHRYIIISDYQFSLNLWSLTAHYGFRTTPSTTFASAKCFRPCLLRNNASILSFQICPTWWWSTLLYFETQAQHLWLKGNNRVVTGIKFLGVCGIIVFCCYKSQLAFWGEDNTSGRIYLTEMVREIKTFQLPCYQF